MTTDLSFLGEYSATQEHFLKKFLVEECLREELHHLSHPGALADLGPPFNPRASGDPASLPMLQYFYSNYMVTFPFLSMNSHKDQVSFWAGTVQPFVDSFNSKNISNAPERKTGNTKRGKANARALRVLGLFYNSMLSSQKEVEYLQGDHLKPSDQGKLDKIAHSPAMVKVGLENFTSPQNLHDYEKMPYINDWSLNIVAVDAAHGNVSRSWSLNPLRALSSHTHLTEVHYSYVVQVTRRSKAEKGWSYNSHFVSRTYKEFKAFEQDLKSLFPALMSTNVGRLPKPIKHDNGIDPSAAVDSSVVSPTPASDSDVGSDVSVSEKGTTKFHREKLRLALRGYINTVVAQREIANSDCFLHFFADEETSFDSLSAEQLSDYEQRVELEKLRLKTQEEFQNQISGTAYHLSKDFEKLKDQLLENPHELSDIFGQFGKSTSMEEVSPLLKSFIEWSKLEVAATIYQMFFSQDSSSTWLHKCRKFHRLFPYKICYGILRFTNPMKIMSRMIDLLLIDVPTFGLSSSPGANSLLVMIFVTLLDEDLDDNSKERQKVLTTTPLADEKYGVFVERIHSYVHEWSNLYDDLREETVRSGTNLFLTILSSDLVEPKLQQADREVFENEIMPSYYHYVEINENNETGGSELYAALKQLWQLDIRTQDKTLMKQLWKEPELTQLLKKCLTVFYSPLIAAMKKCDIHLVFLDFQKFMNDLSDELTRLDGGEMYYLSSAQIFDRFKSLLDKHEGTLWRFVHDLYNKDDTKLFMRLIQWMEGFIVALREKFVNPTKVELDFTQMQVHEPVDAAVLKKELDEHIGLILQKRLLLRSCITNAVANEATSEKDPSGNTDDAPVSHQAAIDRRWAQMNDGILEFSPSDLGVSGEDFNEFNLLNAAEKAADAFGAENGNAKILREIAELDQKLKTRERPEFEKLVGPTHELIRKVLSVG